MLMLSLLGAPLRTRVQGAYLGNGMKILVKETTERRWWRQVWYRAGSMDGVNGSTGVARVLEHMMFKGTKEMAPGQFSRTIARAGGRENAFTTRTARSTMNSCTDRSCARGAVGGRPNGKPPVVQEQFAREIKVVMEEQRLRTDDQPKALLYGCSATAYQVHPYRTPVVGWMTDLEHAGRGCARLAPPLVRAQQRYLGGGRRCFCPEFSPKPNGNSAIAGDRCPRANPDGASHAVSNASALRSPPINPIW
jgi:zinc protease